MNVEFEPDLSLSKIEQVGIANVVSQSHSKKELGLAVPDFFNSSTIKLCGITECSDILGFAFYSTRNWRFNEKEVIGMSVGLVTVKSNVRGRGLGLRLLEAIVDHATEARVDFLYLQAIPDFYVKFGFEAFSPKSKFVFEVSEIPTFRGSIIKVTEDHLSLVANLYSSFSTYIGLSSTRSENQWKDLVGPLSNSFMFYKPSIVIDEKGDVAGYFCMSPCEEGLVREFVPALTEGAARILLSGIGSLTGVHSGCKLEIFSPAAGPILELLGEIKADFHRFYRPKAGNMLKSISEFNVLSLLRDSFIFQGDNL
jgi:predicted acetyltransferase